MTLTGVKRALVSVFDKRDLDEFARGLVGQGAEILSTGGTYRYIRELGVDCTPISDVTGFPEILDGRVKTLHPTIFAGILPRRELEGHMRDLDRLSIEPIDLVAVNLYPFEKTVARQDASLQECIEQIDIGGPSLIRAAAKNYRHVAVVTDPSDYPLLIGELEEKGGIKLETRMGLALKAFTLTASYDTSIDNWMRGRFQGDEPWGDDLLKRFCRVTELRYGENPHQKGAYFRDPAFKGVSLANSEVLWGKELSYNNIYDVDATLDILMEFPDNPCCAIVKHNNPSGVAAGSEGEKGGLAKAYEDALKCDPISAFGGIVGLNRECDLETAELIGNRFYEVVIAPSYEEAALTRLKRKKNLRIIRTDRPIVEEEKPELKWVKVRGGVLLQTMDWPTISSDGWKVVTKVQPTVEQLRDLAFAARITKHVKSNCVVLAKGGMTTGIGAGQMSRVDSCSLAVRKAGGRAAGSVCASDAFFPFRDGIDALAEDGIAAISQPGGSIRDGEVVEAADERGMAMVFTGLRLFKH